MDQQIKITVKDKIASTDFTEVVTFNSVYALKFELDAEWDGFPARVAVIKWAGGAKEKLFTGTECVMPMIDSSDTEQVLIGIYSIKGDKRIASSFVALRCEPGAGGHLQPKPVLTLHDQVLALLNEEHKTLDNPLTIGDKSYNGSESVTVTADDLGLSEVAKTGSYNDLTDKPETFDAPVTSVNGKTGDVVISKYDLTLAEVAISGSYTDLKDKPEIVYPVTSVNGQTGAVTVDADSLGLAAVAKSGNFSDLKGVPESGVLSVNGQTGAVTIDKDTLGLGQLATVDIVGPNNLRDKSVMGKHITDMTIQERSLASNSVSTRTIKDGEVTGIKLADGAIIAGTGASLARGEDGNLTIGLDTSQVVTSLNGQTGAVTVDAEMMGLAQVAFSGKFSDLVDVPETGVYSVNGETGAVTVDADSLGLAAVATSGKFSDLVGAPESGVLSVNGQTGAVTIDKDTLGLGQLATVDIVGPNNLRDKSVMGKHITDKTILERCLASNSVSTRTIKDGEVTGIKFADDVMKAGDGISVSREEETGNFVVGLQPDSVVRSLNGQTGAVEINKETLGLTHVTSERQMPLAADTRKGADFNALFPNGFYHIEGTESDPCENSPVSMENTGYDDCSWFLLVMANSDNSAAVQVAFSARGDFAMRMRGFAKGVWSKWSNIPA